MKKIFVILAVSLVGFSANAQLVKEHTFQPQEGVLIFNSSIFGPTPASFFISETHGLIYILYNSVSKTIHFYKEDYSLFRSTNIGSLFPSNARDLYINIDLISEKLFDLDDSFEFIMYGSCDYNCYEDEWAGTVCDEFSGCFLVKDDGTIIKNFNSNSTNNTAVTLIHSCNTSKLVVQNYYDTENEYGYAIQAQGNVDVYPLPGTLPACYGAKSTLRSTDGQADFRIMPAYPNPTSTNITIPYALKSGEEVTLSIYNSNGVLYSNRIDLRKLLV